MTRVQRDRLQLLPTHEAVNDESTNLSAIYPNEATEKDKSGTLNHTSVKVINLLQYHGLIQELLQFSRSSHSHNSSTSQDADIKDQHRDLIEELCQLELERLQETQVIVWEDPMVFHGMNRCVTNLEHKGYYDPDKILKSMDYGKSWSLVRMTGLKRSELTIMSLLSYLVIVLKEDCLKEWVTYDYLGFMGNLWTNIVMFLMSMVSTSGENTHEVVIRAGARTVS
ncbi:hypothetical protein WICPIJ_001800 [Wickerhamomyces pijperi]|uniref:Uncharacterized protein n=1 Tax=Wickerhamomyces pijperi TaxID=599730 RepID=A0A9P8QCW0_WICPI|nr:hypothetical protein WICPIJ_001800 [Wickerhamomyces pijperi]